MSVPTLGDLSQSYSMRRRNVELRQEIDTLTKELASGQVANVREVLGGNYSYLTQIEQRKQLLQGYSIATAEAALFTDAVQNTLGMVEQVGADLSASLLTAGTTAIGVSGTDTVTEAVTALDGMIGALNSNAAGRYLFSGGATDQPALPDAQTILDTLRAAVAGAATPEDLLSATEAWFDDPAGFSATLYQGADEGLSPFALDETDRVSFDIRATDPKLREVLRLASVAALADDPAFGFDIPAQSELFNQTGQALLAGQDDIISLRASVGFVEERVEKAVARNAAEITSLEFAKTALLEADPYETATRLENAQFQLQSLYAVTVRMSQLSLLNYL